MSELDEFLAGERLDDVALFLADEYLDSGGKLATLGEDVEDGVVLVVPGEEGRRAFAAGTGLDPMTFARQASARDGRIDPDLGGGECPDADTGSGDGDAEESDGIARDAEESGEDHRVQFVFAFAEGRNEEVGGLYAEGDVVHAYARCSCGTAYSDRWVAGTR